MDLFKNNKYTKWYYQIIGNASLREPPLIYERHHIIPRSMGGKDIPVNLIKLSRREHYLVHLLLTKMCIHQAHTNKMIYAADMMVSRTTQTKTSRLYEHISTLRRKEQSRIMKINEAHLRLHSIENSEKARITKISRKYKAWNRGIPNPNGVINGKRSASKMKTIATGRRRYYKNDGSWTWIYQRLDGTWFLKTKLSKYSRKIKEVDVTPPLLITLE